MATSSSAAGRPLKVDDRHIWLSIMEMIQANAVKAMVEFITNSDDTYARLEARGKTVTGRILIDVIERRGDEDSEIRVVDDGEGFSEEELDACFGTMGKDTSGQASGFVVRGFFGDGLKEGVLGLKRGGVLRTIKNGLFAQAELFWEGQTPMYRLRQAATPVTSAKRRELGLQGDGAHLTVFVHPEVRIPRHDPMVEQISRYYALRDIVQNPARTILVRRLNAREKVVQQDEAVYQEPISDPTFGEVVLAGSVPGYGVGFTLRVKRSTEPLSGEAGPLREGGLLVRARRAIIDIGFFGLENRPGTEYLFGHLDCDGLYDRLKGGDLVINKNRSGLNRSNDFVKAILAETARLLGPVVQQEADRLKHDSGQPVDPKSRKRLDELKQELNRIAHAELAEEGDEEGDSEGSPILRFSRKGFSLYVDEPKTVRVLAQVAALEESTDLKLVPVGGGLTLQPDAFQLSAADAVNGVVIVDAQLTGSRELETGLVEAYLGQHRAAATIVVKTRFEVVPPAFAFEHDRYRLPVAQWRDLSLRIHVPSVAGLPAEVSFTLDAGELQLRADAQIADPRNAVSDWVTLRVRVRGDQIGAEDTLEARMGPWVATARLRVVSASEKDQTNQRGGLIRNIRFDARENPVQRTLFQDGDITVYVNHPSVRRYISKHEDRERPAGRVLIADLVMHAFCRYVAERTYRDDPFVTDPETALHTVFNTYERMMKKYGERLHAIMNPA